MIYLIYADRTGPEVFASNGLVFILVNFNLDPENKSLSLSSKGDTAITANTALGIFS